eukprot:COSAG04_NODE_68_length_29323_cov_9.683514_6_plen_131_part_00
MCRMSCCSFRCCAIRRFESTRCRRPARRAASARCGGGRPSLQPPITGPQSASRAGFRGILEPHAGSRSREQRQYRSSRAPEARSGRSEAAPSAPVRVSEASRWVSLRQVLDHACGHWRPLVSLMHQVDDV